MTMRIPNLSMSDSSPRSAWSTWVSEAHGAEARSRLRLYMTRSKPNMSAARTSTCTSRVPSLYSIATSFRSRR